MEGDQALPVNGLVAGSNLVPVRQGGPPQLVRSQEDGLCLRE